MKIAHIITRLVAGGAQRNTLTCARHQQQTGHRVVVLSGTETGTEGSLLGEAQSSDYQWVGLPSLVRRVSPTLDLKAFLELCALFRREKFDLVHTHTSKAGILGRLAARHCGVPIVVHTPHGHVFHSYFADWKAKVFELAERLTAPLADSLVMLSGQELRDHLDAGIANRNNSVVIPSGVNTEPLLKLEHEGSGFVVGYVGRLADIKGPLDLVEAFAIHSAAHPASRLLMVGDGPLRVDVEKRIDQVGLRGRAEITGWQTNIMPYLQRMSLLAVPSHNEGMGRVVVEAMAAGVPVLASAVGGLLDLVDDRNSGLLLPAKAPSEWAATLNRLAQQPPEALRQMGERARNRSELFSEKVMLSRLDELYAYLSRRKLLLSE